MKKNEEPLIFYLHEFGSIIQLWIPEHQLELHKTCHEPYYKFPVTKCEFSRYFDGKDPNKKNYTIVVINLHTGRPFKIFREPEYRFEWIPNELYVVLKIYIRITAG